MRDAHPFSKLDDVLYYQEQRNIPELSDDRKFLFQSLPDFGIEFTVKFNHSFIGYPPQVISWQALEIRQGRVVRNSDR